MARREGKSLAHGPFKTSSVFTETIHFELEELQIYFSHPSRCLSMLNHVIWLHSLPFLLLLSSARRIAKRTARF